MASRLSIILPISYWIAAFPYHRIVCKYPATFLTVHINNDTLSVNFYLKDTFSVNPKDTFSVTFDGFGITLGQPKFHFPIGNFTKDTFSVNVIPFASTFLETYCLAPFFLIGFK